MDQNKEEYPQSVKELADKYLLQRDFPKEIRNKKKCNLEAFKEYENHAYYFFTVLTEYQVRKEIFGSEKDEFFQFIIDQIFNCIYSVGHNLKYVGILFMFHNELSDENHRKNYKIKDLLNYKKAFSNFYSVANILSEIMSVENEKDIPDFKTYVFFDNRVNINMHCLRNFKSLDHEFFFDILYKIFKTYNERLINLINDKYSNPPKYLEYRISSCIDLINAWSGKQIFNIK